MELSFGQPLGAIVQYAYVVESIDRAATDYVDRLGIGPWFVRGPFHPDLLPSGSRIVYVDSARDLPGMIELVEHTEAQEQVYDTIYRASVYWDGGEPLRQSDI